MKSPLSRYQTKSGRSDSMSVNSTQPLVVPERRRYSQQDSPAASPSATTLSPTFNPWYIICPVSFLIVQYNYFIINCRKTSSLASVVGSPPVSMREVMAEAEAEQRRRKGQERHITITRANEGVVHRTNGEK